MADPDLDSEIFAHCMPSGAQNQASTQAESSLPQKRQRPEQSRPNGRMPGRTHHQKPPFPTYSAPPFQTPPSSGMPSLQPESQIRLLSKIVLKQEEQLSLLRRDTQFVLFMRQDDKSILPALMTAAREWQNRQESSEGQPMQSSKRTVLLNCLLRELLARVQRIAATEQGRESLKKAEWLQNDNAWAYLRWAPKQRRLVVDDSRAPLLHDEAVRTLSELQKSITGDIVTKFNSTVNLARLEEEGSQQAVFHLAISLRGSGAAEVHEQLCKLVGSSITNLAAFSMKRDDLFRPPMVKQLAQMTYGGGGLSPPPHTPPLRMHLMHNISSS